MAALVRPGRAAGVALPLPARRAARSLARAGRRRLAASLHYTGQADDALSLAREGLSLARAARLRKEEALCLNIISIVSLQGDTSASLEDEERQIEICRETGNA